MIRLKLTSCGGTSNETVLRSMMQNVSMQGMMKKIPGPLAPPFSRRPRRNITTLSYSWTTLMQKHMEKGKVTITKMSAKAVNRTLAKTFEVSLELAAMKLVFSKSGRVR